MNEPAPQSRGRLLVADDEDLVRKTIAALLVQHGFACTCVASGAEVLDQLRQHEFDALVTDLEMPGNDGLSLIESVPLLAVGMPIVVLTGKPTVETAAGSLRLPVAAYLTKPPDYTELVAVLDEAILKSRTYRAMQAGQRRLQDWDKELETVLRHCRSHDSQPEGPMGCYLRLSLRHAILVLSELEQAARALEHGPDKAQTLRQLDREVALRRAVDVLRRTKQNFKSKELADLRMELERLLAGSDPAEAPQEN